MSKRALNYALENYVEYRLDDTADKVFIEDTENKKVFELLPENVIYIGVEKERPLEFYTFEIERLKEIIEMAYADGLKAADESSVFSREKTPESQDFEVVFPKVKGKGPYFMNGTQKLLQFTSSQNIPENSEARLVLNSPSHPKVRLCIRNISKPYGNGAKRKDGKYDYDCLASLITDNWYDGILPCFFDGQTGWTLEW